MFGLQKGVGVEVRHVCRSSCTGNRTFSRSFASGNASSVDRYKEFFICSTHGIHTRHLPGFGRTDAAKEYLPALVDGIGCRGDSERGGAEPAECFPKRPQSCGGWAGGAAQGRK